MEKIQMTEEQAREFIKPIFINHSFYEPNMESAINELKEAGYIRKSELLKKVEEAERAFKGKMDKLIIWTSWEDVARMQFEVIQLFKEKYPEWDK